jgi:hypothetical protein
MGDISGFKWDSGSWHVGWRDRGRYVMKQYMYPIQKALPLRDGSAVAIIEPYEIAGRDNAVVFNADGSERFRLKFPRPRPFGCCYTNVYYEGDDLYVYTVGQDVDLRYRLNERTGELGNGIESR